MPPSNASKSSIRNLFALAIAMVVALGATSIAEAKGSRPSHKSSSSHHRPSTSSSHKAHKPAHTTKKATAAPKTRHEAFQICSTRARAAKGTGRSSFVLGDCMKSYGY